MDYAEKYQKSKGNNSLLWISLALLGGLVASYFIFPAFKGGINEAFGVITSEDPARIKIWVKRFGALGPIVLILAMTAQMFLLIIPNLLLFIIAIICYGPIWGSLICLTGVFASSSLGFMIGRKLGPGAIDRFVSEKAQKKISVFVKRYGAKAIAIARLSSLASDALGFVAGILEMQYKKFIIATMSGVLPVIILIAIFGKSGKIERGLLLIAGISLIVLGVYIFLDRKKRQAEINGQ
ncbi:TVP38/TMEM64 family protein [Dyadobacter psychrotolerans]|uniref:TVP38/TMEM64 family membrane protein n=1 Tax=Dyadobacter psychrotolerans TaxID=2541721 RepID=A0A4R5DWY9_9BACT|nr:VTT domain-containing protein [Dyadobacter psychrotolerans]TDE17154.1 TVP38/TMEM64 family protein [Dyadobacter psychrotolerans]